jgi:hypothetical protein
MLKPQPAAYTGKVRRGDFCPPGYEPSQRLSHRLSDSEAIQRVGGAETVGTAETVTFPHIYVRARAGAHGMLCVSGVPGVSLHIYNDFIYINQKLSWSSAETVSETLRRWGQIIPVQRLKAINNGGDNGR